MIPRDYLPIRSLHIRRYHVGPLSVVYPPTESESLYLSFIDSYLLYIVVYLYNRLELLNISCLPPNWDLPLQYLVPLSSLPRPSLVPPSSLSRPSLVPLSSLPSPDIFNAVESSQANTWAALLQVSYSWKTIYGADGQRSSEGRWTLGRRLTLATGGGGQSEAMCMWISKVRVL